MEPGVTQSTLRSTGTLDFHCKRTGGPSLHLLSLLHVTLETAGKQQLATNFLSHLAGFVPYRRPRRVYILCPRWLLSPSYSTFHSTFKVPSSLVSIVSTSSHELSPILRLYYTPCNFPSFPPTSFSLPPFGLQATFTNNHLANSLSITRVYYLSPHLPALLGNEPLQFANSHR